MLSSVAFSGQPNGPDLTDPKARGDYTAMPLQPQAALEQATVNLMRTAVLSGGLGYTSLFCGRQFDGNPPPVARGKWYAAVWHDGVTPIGRNSAATTALDETHGLYVTITVELVQPADLWVQHRDELEAKARAIATLIHGDVYNNVIVNAANVLAGFRIGSTPGADRVGFVRGLAYEGGDAIVEAGAEWLGGQPDSSRCCIYQRLRFGGAIRIQALPDME
jgi:hypothetical protein